MLLLAAFALFAGSAVQAATHTVDVGAGGLTYTPSSVSNAASGDIVLFTFKSGAHTVTQSTFADPCTPLSGGVDSGAKDTASASTPPTYNYTVNGTAPAWFYCKTGAHCKAGMVFAINPTADKTFDAFQQKAKGGTSAASGSSSGTAPAATGSGAATGHATAGIGAVAAALLFGGLNAL